MTFSRTIGITELNTGYRFNSRATATTTDGGYGKITHNQSNERFAVSYVTGSHAFKTGLFMQEGVRHHLSYMIGDRAYTVRGGRRDNWSRSSRLLPSTTIGC